MRMRTNVGAIILIVIGAVFLASNLGYVPHLGELLRVWWPLILILIGVALLAKRA
jgi:hypothetical protein